MKKSTLIICKLIILSFLPFVSIGQEVDSLLNIVEELEGVEKADAYIVIANEYLIKYDYQNGLKSLEYAQKAEKLSEEIDYQKGLCLALTLQSTVYLRQGITDVAYDLNLNALRIATEMDDSDLMTGVYNNLGILHGTMGEMSKALDNFNKALELARERNIPSEIATYLTNLGMVYTRMNQTDDALALQLEAVEITREMGTSDELVHALTNIGETYQNQEKYRQAITYYKESLSLREFADLQGLERNYGGLAACYLGKNDFAQAIFYGEKGIEIGKELGDPSWFAENYEILSLAYERAGNYKKALETQKEFKTTSDQLYDDRQSSRVQELEVKYNLEQEQAEKKLLAQRLKFRNIVSYVAIVVIILLILVALLFFQNARTNSRFNERLKQEVTERTEELEKTNNQLKASNKDLENYAYVASHDMKEPLRNIVSFSSLLHRKLRHSDDEYVLTYLNFIKNSGTQLNNLIKSTLELGMVTNNDLKFAKVDLNELVNSVKNSSEMANQGKEIEIIVHELPIVLGNKEGLEQVFTNLITNAIKYNKSKVAKVEIYAKATENKHTIFVKDNGIGIDEAYHDQVFKMYKRLHNRAEYIGSGLGLTICKRIIEAHFSEINLESRAGQGSTFSFVLEEYAE